MGQDLFDLIDNEGVRVRTVMLIALREVAKEIHELRQEIKSIRAAATPMTGPPRAGADLTSPAPAVSPGDRYPWRMENDEDDGA